MEQYFRFRVTDGGADFWLRMSFPIYRDDYFTEHWRSRLAARMTVRGLTVVNDAYSFSREQSLGQIANSQSTTSTPCSGERRSVT